MAQSSSGGVALRYVIPVLWMTSRLTVMGRTVLRGRPDGQRREFRARPGRSLMSMNACFTCNHGVTEYRTRIIETVCSTSCLSVYTSHN